MEPIPRLLCTAALLAVVAPASTAGQNQESVKPLNVLLVILDDVPVDAVACYDGSVPSAKTPCLDRLAARGVRFDSVWSNPSCSPTRATIMTGRYGFRTGVGSVIRHKEDDPGLLHSEVCLPEAIRAANEQIATAFLGKWHLRGVSHGPDHPREQGFQHFRGTMSNLGNRKTPERYFGYREFIDGVEARREEYSTTAVTNDAIAAIGGIAESENSAPWFVVASYHAAHTPFHAPPAELHTRDVTSIRSQTSPAYFPAMVEALDHEVGRLVDSIPEGVAARTLVVVVGDNGGASSADQDGETERQGPGKGSLFESGIKVPLIVAGPAVKSPGRACEHLVNTSDLFDSIVEWTTGNAPAGTPDSASIQPYLRDPAASPVRTWIFAERFRRGIVKQKELWSSRLAIRGPRFKLIEDETRGILRFFDLDTDPRERRNLLANGPMDDTAIAELARLTVILAGDLGDARWEALADFR